MDASFTALTEMQIKTTMTYHYTQIRIDSDNTEYWYQLVEKLNLSSKNIKTKHT